MYVSPRAIQNVSSSRCSVPPRYRIFLHQEDNKARGANLDHPTLGSTDSMMQQQSRPDRWHKLIRNGLLK